MKRSFLLGLAALGLALQSAAACVEAATSSNGRPPLASTSRGVVVEMSILAASPRMALQFISTGRGWVLLESDEGQEIARETAVRFTPVNLRSDGSLRGRQHHQTDFLSPRPAAPGQ